jgi:membrane-associated phospholipid phosphatase
MSDRRNRRRPRQMLVATCLACAALAAAPADLAAQTIAPDSQNRPSISTSAPAPVAMQDVIADAIQDFKRIPSWTNIAILAAGGLGAAMGHTSDRSVSTAMSGSQRLGTVFGLGEAAGGARMQLFGALGTYAVGRFSGHNKIATIGADLIQSQIVAQSMTAAIKMSVNRTRPDGTQYSFPSGHSSVTFATATVLQRDLGWKVGIPAYGFATYVAASRIQDKRHFLSDVAFGAAIGIVAGRSVTVGKGDTKFAVAPSATPGGGGISFTWLGSSR